MSLVTQERQVEDLQRRAPSVLWVLGATLVSGVSGYLVLWLVARTIGAVDYATFGVFWSGLFLVVGVVFGIQQETTRATALERSRAHVGGRVRSNLWVFAGVAAAVVALIVLASGAWWGPAALGADDAGLTFQIGLGSAANVLVATLSGVLAGAKMWRHLGAIIALDGLIRLAAVALALSLSDDPAVLAWAVIVPFPLSLAVVSLATPRVISNCARSPLTYRQLVANSSQTMLAASATALLINGFPLVLAFFADPSEKALLGALILAITITRAPVLVPLMALQSYLVTRFTGSTASPWNLILKAFSLIGALMVVLAMATYWWGTSAFSAIIGVEFALSTTVLVPLVVSSGFIGALCVTGPALLAHSNHRAYAIGWLSASAVSVAMLFLPVELETKAALALSVGPVAGLVLHLAALRFQDTKATATH